MSGLDFDIEPGESHGVVVKLHGHLTAGAGAVLSRIAKKIKKGASCVIDLEDLTIVTSVGARDWLGFLKDFSETREVALARCQPNFVMTLSLLRAFAPKVTVQSVFASYACPGCATEESRLLEVGVDVRSGADDLLQARCKRCGGRLREEFPVRDYFEFLHAK